MLPLAAVIRVCFYIAELLYIADVVLYEDAEVFLYILLNRFIN